MSTSSITPNRVYENPFDRPLNSELQEHQQAQAATQAASSNGNPFDEPLASEKAEQQAQQAGQVTNDVGQQVIVPREGESFAETMKRGAALGKQRQQNGTQQQAIDAEMATAPKKVAETLGAAAGIGAVGPALLALPGELGPVFQHLDKLKNIVDYAGKLGFGAVGLAEAHKLYKEFVGK